MTNEKDSNETNDNGPKLGLFPDIPNEDYHRSPGISKSGLDLINQSPAHYRVNRLHPKPSTPAMRFGSAAHSLILEPEQFSKEYIKAPENAPRRPTERQINAKNPSKETLAAIDYWDQFENDSAGKEIIINTPGADPFWQPGDWDKLHFMAESVRNHPVANLLLDLDAGKAEQSVYWIDLHTRKLCKCRPDFVNLDHNICVDLKTTNDASFSGFSKSVASFRYHVQDAFYQDGLYAAGHGVQSFVFVAVEKDPPYAVACYSLDKEAKFNGRGQYEHNLRVYKECFERDEWPGYPSDQSIFEPSVRNLQVAPWGLKGSIS